MAELLEDDEAIDHEVAESCEFVSVLYDCISEVETAQGQAISVNSEPSLPGSSTPLS